MGGVPSYWERTASRALKSREGTPSPRLNDQQFLAPFLSEFPDRAFDPMRDELARVAAAAWDAYDNQRKSARTRKAGSGFADPDYDLAEDWIAARAAIQAAQARHDDPAGPLRVLLISCSSRSEHTCPSEMSKSFQLTEIAREVFATVPGVRTQHLELSRLAAEYGRHIHPCKACFPPPPRSAIGPAPATRTTRWGRRRTG